MSLISPIKGPLGQDLPAAHVRASQAAWTAYQAASQDSHELAEFWPVSGSADRDLLYDRQLIVDRVRDLVRNNGWASGAVARELDTVVGAQLRPEPRPNAAALGIDLEAAAELAEQMATEVTLWGNDPRRLCDATRHDNWAGLSGLQYRHLAIDGEQLTLILWRPRGGRYATCLRVVDPDRLSNPQGQPNDDHLRDGVALDDDGAAIGYWITRAHPRDVGISALGGMEWIYSPRETPWGRPLVVHDFTRDRADQHRGLSDFAPILRNAKMLDRYQAAELASALLNATLAAFIESPFDHEFLMDLLGEPAGKQSFDTYNDLRSGHHDKHAITVGGVKIPALFPGEKIGFFNPNRPSPQMEAFSDAMMRNMASGLPAHTAETVTLDYRKMNYSSSRAARLVAGLTVVRKRLLFGARTGTPIYAAVMEEAFMTGRIKPPKGAPPFHQAREAYLQADWLGPPQGYVDPVKEAQAAGIRVDGNLSTLQDECAAQGNNWRDVMLQKKREQDFAAKLGLQTQNLPAALAIKAPTDGPEDHTPSDHDDAEARLARFEAWASRIPARVAA